MIAGTSLGPYEITARIGAGGMGEVWRACDQRLGRDVAIKLLPRAFAADSDRVRRFELEARAAGSLNHPNLITIFDSGSDDGMAYIVMELLEGETLRDKIGPDSRLPLRKVIDYSVQIATGLAAAHERGIVHRDLKPENLFVCKDGRVKILDFGLAKLTEQTAAPDAVTDLRMETSPGMVMGTLAYMSPEQLRALKADHRSDIFAFGSILFEMLSGRRAFAGETAADVMSAILNQDPADSFLSSGDVPPAMGGIVRHCLEKSPDERFQSARDLAFHLQTLTGSAPVPPTVVASTTKSRARLTIGAVIGATATILAVLAIAVALVRHTGYRILRPHPRIVEASQLTFQPGVEANPSFAPDGKSFLFVAGMFGNNDIYLQRTDGRNAINLTKDSPDDDSEPAFSPDGSQIVFRSERNGGGLYVMGATGETVRRISDFGEDPSWSPDGTKIVCSTEAIGFWPRNRGSDSALWIVDVRTGAKRLLTSAGRPVQPSWSPHGNRVAYWTVDAASNRDLVTIDASATNAQPVRLTTDPALEWNPVWSPDGAFVYFGSDRGGTMGLWRIAIDEKSGRARGEAEPVTLPARFASHFSFDRSGKQLIFASHEQLDSIHRVPLTGGLPSTVVAGSIPIFKFDLSPDGQSIVYTTQDRSEEIFIARSEGGESRQITDSPDLKRAASWTPDGRILFYSNRSGTMQVWRINADGSGLTQITDAQVPLWYPKMSPDGKSILASNSVNSFLIPTSAIPARSGALFPAPAPDTYFMALDWSADSRRVVGLYTRPNGDFLSKVAIYDTTTRTYELVSTFGVAATWMPDGKSLIIADGKKLHKADLATHTITDLPLAVEASDFITLAVSPDGRYIYWQELHAEGDLWRATLDDL